MACTGMAVRLPRRQFREQSHECVLDFSIRTCVQLLHGFCCASGFGGSVSDVGLWVDRWSFAGDNPCTLCVPSST